MIAAGRNAPPPPRESSLPTSTSGGGAKPTTPSSSSSSTSSAESSPSTRLAATSIRGMGDIDLSRDDGLRGIGDLDESRDATIADTSGMRDMGGMIAFPPPRDIMSRGMLPPMRGDWKAPERLRKGSSLITLAVGRPSSLCLRQETRKGPEYLCMYEHETLYGSKYHR